MAIIKWDPFWEMISFRDKIDKRLEDEVGKTQEKGILKITVSKAPELKPKKIPILPEGK